MTAPRRQAEQAGDGPEAQPAKSQSEQAQREAAERALALAAEAGIHRLRVPTPFQVGRVNAYLIEGSPLTLLDSGPNSAKAMDELEQALAAHGRAVEDLELLIVTHQHIDHFGLASILARRSGAQVAALDLLAPYLASFGARAEDDDRFAETMMLRHGIPPEVVTALRAVSGSFRGWGAAVEVTRPLAHGSQLQLEGRTLRVLHRPGHSPSDTVFVDESRGIMLAADHLIGHISSNPLLARPLQRAPQPGAEQQGPAAAPTDARPQALLTYLESLRLTREMELELVLPGHGDPITDHVSVIDERFRLHRRRADKIHTLLGEGPATAHEIAQQLWGNVAVTQAYLTLSEVLGHMDVLLAEDRAQEHESDGVVRFRAT